MNFVIHMQYSFFGALLPLQMQGAFLPSLRVLLSDLLGTLLETHRTRMRLTTFPLLPNVLFLLFLLFQLLLQDSQPLFEVQKRSTAGAQSTLLLCTKH